MQYYIHSHKKKQIFILFEIIVKYIYKNRKFWKIFGKNMYFL